MGNCLNHNQKIQIHHPAFVPITANPLSPDVVNWIETLQFELWSENGELLDNKSNLNAQIAGSFELQTGGHKNIILKICLPGISISFKLAEPGNEYDLTLGYYCRGIQLRERNSYGTFTRTISWYAD